ncbi:hypothetical protein [Lysobacter xanthus]
MKKLFASVALLVLTSTASAERVGTKLTYPKAELAPRNAYNVPSIVDRFSADTGRTSLINPSRVLFLLDGKASPAAASQLEKSDRVEVLSDGDSIVINVVMKPTGNGA